MRWSNIRSEFEESKQRILNQSARFQSDLPLRFLNQQAHFTVPASDYALLQKAVERGFGSSAKILAKYQITETELSRLWEVPAQTITDFLSSSPHAPLVMVDGEDAQALLPEVVARGRKNAVHIFQEADWKNTLRFYRPSGIQLEYCVNDLIGVVGTAGDRIDGVIIPKIDHPEELAWVCSLLSRIEEQLGLVPNQIKLQFLVESGWAVVNLERLVEVSLPRLAGIIFGIADYSASINLPEISNNHPACDAARIRIVQIASAVGVPAIDSMTVNYPVASAQLDFEANRTSILARLDECFRDARHAESLGMDGKWVGHPLQLFATLIAFQTARDASEIEAEMRKIEAYQTAVSQELGATIINGVMSDRATDRHARQKLKKAVATGRISQADAIRLGILNDSHPRKSA